MTSEKSGNKISIEFKNKIAYIGFGYNDSKSMTVLDEETLNELDQYADQLKIKANELDGIIFFSHKKNCFLAGADINLIASMNTEAEAAEGATLGQKIFSKIDDLKTPTVCCVHGVCMGGGLEFALSCKNIISGEDNKTSLALPEVKLGLIPGFGGTYRLPLRVGLPTALEMILSGKTIKGRKAKRIGLSAEVYPYEKLVEFAPLYFKNKTVNKEKKLFEKIEDLAQDNMITKKIIFQKARENVLKKTKGLYQAPLRILETMESGMGKSRNSYLEMESSSFGELCVSKQSQNLQHIFFMNERSKKYSGATSDNDLTLKRGAVLGAGTMGGGIAWLMADNDMFPIMKDLNEKALNLGLKQASSNFSGAVKRKKISLDEFERKMHSISAQLNFSGFKNTDLIIEAVVEKMEIKKSVFTEVENYVSDKCLITSNTSSLSVEEMASSLKNSSRFAGLHFFNPVHRMPLVEIITHENIAPETISSLYKWCIKAKKTPVVVKDGPGFLVNRILMPFLNEAGYMLEEGVSIEDLDKACENFGFPMGPCRLLDEVGIDVGSKVAKILYDGFGKRMKPSTFLNKMIDKSLLGRKTNAGFYLYDEKGKVESVNDEVVSMLPTKNIKLSETEIQMRVVLPMINEASFVLDDKIVNSSEEVDLGLIFGIGFPPFRGGLLRYADSLGGDKIKDLLNKYSESVDNERFKISPYLSNLIDKKIKLYEN